MSRVLSVVVILLVLLGVAAGIARAVFISDFTIRAYPLRVIMFARLGLTDPNLEERREVVRHFDDPYAAHPIMTLVHVVPGAAFLALAPLQFVGRLRRRHLELHRVLGRCLVIGAMVAGVGGLFFGMFAPFAGTAERIPVALIGVLLLFTMSRGYFAIRQGDQDSHRRWMIRAFALCLTISSMRVAEGILDIFLAPRGYDSRDLFAMSIWIGWLLTSGAAEMWIALTRPRPSASAAAS